MLQEMLGQAHARIVKKGPLPTREAGGRMVCGRASPLSRLDGAGAAVSAGAPSDGDGRSDCVCCAPHALLIQVRCDP